MLSKLYNTAKQGVGKLGDSLSGRFSRKQTFHNDMYLPDQTAQQPKIQELHQPEPQQYAQAKQPPLREHYQEPQPQDIYTKASENAYKKYGVEVPPYFLRAVQQQESSGIVDENNYNLSMGITPTAIEALGEDYLDSTSLDNVIQNSANYLASKARGTLHSGESFDLSTPENYSKWYVQRYVGLYPGESRDMGGGQMVSYEDIVKMFERRLLEQQNQ